MTDKVNEKNAEGLGTDYWEVDWHMGARNTGTGYLNHQSWQGKVYSSEEMRTVCGLGEMLGLIVTIYGFHFFPESVSASTQMNGWRSRTGRKMKRGLTGAANMIHTAPCSTNVGWSAQFGSRSRTLSC